MRVLGPAACDRAPRCGRELHLRPDLAWIETDGQSRELAELLRAVHRGRSRARSSTCRKVPNIGNPQFDHELAYATLTFPTPAISCWDSTGSGTSSICWFPYRDQLDEDWDKVLAEFIPRIALAKDKNAYQLEMIALIAQSDGTHANLWSAPPQLRPPAGECQLP